MWMYCGGRTAELVADEVGNNMVAVNMVDDVLVSCKEGLREEYRGIFGVIITDMSLTTLINWEEVRRMAGLFRKCRVVVLTSRPGGVPPHLDVPGNVEIKEVERVRVSTIEDVLKGVVE